MLETVLEVLATLPTKSSSAQQALLRQQTRHVLYLLWLNQTNTRSHTCWGWNVVTLRVSKLMLHIKADLDTHQVVQRTGNMHIKPAWPRNTNVNLRTYMYKSFQPKPAARRAAACQVEPRCSTNSHMQLQHVMLFIFLCAQGSDVSHPWCTARWVGPQFIERPRYTNLKKQCVTWIPHLTTLNRYWQQSLPTELNSCQGQRDIPANPFFFLLRNRGVTEVACMSFGPILALLRFPRKVLETRE